MTILGASKTLSIVGLALVLSAAALGTSTETLVQAKEVPAARVMELRGTVVGDDGSPMSRGEVIANGIRTPTSPDGEYLVRVPESPAYALKCEASDFYSIVHTFDQGEIEAWGGALPTVVLVKKKPGRVMFAFGGDTMMGRRFHQPLPGEPQWIRPGQELSDSKALLKHIKAYTELADYSSVNLESTLMYSEPPKKAEKSYTFFSHPDTLPALAWAGVDFVSLGNNHTNDYLNPGLEATISALAKSSISFSGAGLDEPNALAAHRVEIHGNSFSLLGFVGWKGKVTPNQVAEGRQKGGAAHGGLENIVSTVAEEAAAGRAVIVQYHGGSEYSYSPTEIAQQRLRAAIDHGADLVIGHHPHVVQGFEVYKGKLIAYSLGNFLFDQYRYETQRSALVYVWMDGEDFHRAEIAPIHIQNYHTTPATGNVRDYVLRRILHQSTANGVWLSVSGGHGTISSHHGSVRQNKTKTNVELAPWHAGTMIQRLPLRWYQQPTALPKTTGGTSYRFGRDILLLGDLEQHRVFGMAESMWRFNMEDSGIINSSRHRGHYSMKLASPGADGSFARQKYFHRFVETTPSSAMSFVGYAKSSGEARLSVCIELWPGDWNRARAMENPQQKHIQTIEVDQDTWKAFVVNCEPLDAKLEGFRLCLKNEASDEGAGGTIFLDDLALVCWEAKNETREDAGVGVGSNRYDYIHRVGEKQTRSTPRLEITDLTRTSKM